MAQYVTNKALPAAVLDRGWAVYLALPEQGEDQPHQFPGGEHQCSLMLMFLHLLGFGLIEGPIRRIVYPQCVGGFDQVVAQVAISRSKHSPILCFKLAGLMTSPDEACHFCDGVIAADAMDVPDFSQDTGGVDWSDARQRGQGVRKGFNLISNSAVNIFEAGLKRPDVSDEIGKDEVLRAGQLRPKPVGFSSGLLDFVCHVCGVWKSVPALFDQERHQIFDRLVDDFFRREEFFDQGGSSGTQGASQWVLLRQSRALEEQVREEMVDLSYHGSHHMKAVAGQSFHREIRVSADMRGRKVSSQAHEVCNDRGIHPIGLIHLAGGFSESGDPQGIKAEDPGLPGSKTSAGSQEICKMPVIEGCSFHTYGEGLPVPLLKVIVEQVFNGRGPGGTILEFFDFYQPFSGMIHQLSGERLAGYINTDIQSFSHVLYHLLSCGQEVQSSPRSRGAGGYASSLNQQSRSLQRIHSRGTSLQTEKLAWRLKGVSQRAVSIHATRPGSADFRSGHNARKEEQRNPRLSHEIQSGQKCSERLRSILPGPRTIVKQGFCDKHEKNDFHNAFITRDVRLTHIPVYPEYSYKKSQGIYLDN